MKRRPALIPTLLVPLALILPAAATGPADTTGSIPGLLFTTVLANLGIAFTVVLMFVFALYAYASLARLAPYHTWISLYLVSLTGIVWSIFLVTSGGPVSDSIFILTTVIGVNLIVHILRFDRVEIPSRNRQEHPAIVPFDF